MTGVKKKIYLEIDNMRQNELALLYEQIQFIKRANAIKEKTENPISIEELHRYTSSSKSSWAESVIEERKDRI